MSATHPPDRPPADEGARRNPAHPRAPAASQRLTGEAARSAMGCVAQVWSREGRFSTARPLQLRTQAAAPRRHAGDATLPVTLAGGGSQDHLFPVTRTVARSHRAADRALARPSASVAASAASLRSSPRPGSNEFPGGFPSFRFPVSRANIACISDFRFQISDFSITAQRASVTENLTLISPW